MWAHGSDLWRCFWFLCFSMGEWSDHPFREGKWKTRRKIKVCRRWGLQASEPGSSFNLHRQLWAASPDTFRSVSDVGEPAPVQQDVQRLLKHRRLELEVQAAWAPAREGVCADGP